MGEQNGDNFNEEELQALKARAFTAELKGLIEKVVVSRGSSDDDASALVREYHALFYRIVNDLQGQGSLRGTEDAKKTGMGAIITLLSGLGVSNFALYNYELARKSYAVITKSDDAAFPPLIAAPFFSDKGVDPFHEYFYDGAVYLTGNVALFRMTKNSLDSFPPLPLIAFTTELSGRERELLVDAICFSREFILFVLSSSIRAQIVPGAEGIMASMHISALYHSSKSSAWFFLKGNGVTYEQLVAVKEELSKTLSNLSHLYLFSSRGIVIFASQADIQSLQSFYLDLRVKSERKYVLSELPIRSEQQLLNFIVSTPTG